MKLVTKTIPNSLAKKTTDFLSLNINCLINIAPTTPQLRKKNKWRFTHNTWIRPKVKNTHHLNCFLFMMRISHQISKPRNTKLKTSGRTSALRPIRGRDKTVVITSGHQLEWRLPIKKKKIKATANKNAYKIDKPLKPAN